MIRPVEPTSPTARAPNGDRRRADDPRAASMGDEPTGRMLVPTAPRQPTDKDLRSGRPARPLAAFLAHVLATEAGDPQTRARRRLPIDETVTRYVASAERPIQTRATGKRSVRL